MKFIDFTGEETEKEFLQKCIEQWETTIESSVSDMGKVMQLGAVFSEMRHRIDELD